MTYQLALFGHPVKHSLSPQIHHQFAQQFDLEIDYQLIDVTTDQLHQRVQQFFENGGYGANITVPHKQHIIKVSDKLTDRAQQAGAVNTLFLKDHQLWGDNTDGDGLINDFQQKTIFTKNKRILIIGAGGAVQGILPSLLKTQPTAIYIHNRTQAKSQTLAATSPHCYALNDTENNQSFDLIINGTSLGHRGLSPDLKTSWTSAKTTAYDLSYGPAAKPFLNKLKTYAFNKPTTA
jgi:Shikimate 5-dehydrogenase